MLHDEHIYDCQRHPLLPIDGASLDEGQKRFKELCEEAAAAVSDKIHQILEKALKEAPAMQVSYNGFTGELVKLERCQDEDYFGKFLDVYKISIYDSAKNVSISADGVKLEDVKFLGGAVSFG